VNPPVTAARLASAANACRRALAEIGRFARRRASFLLMLAALSWGVLQEGFRPRSWRRTVVAEYLRVLRQAAGGGLPTALVTAGLTGLALVAHAIYWLGLAGELELEGSILVTVLVRELAPLLVGMVLLGRSGTRAMVEIGRLKVTGQLHVMTAQGLDPVLLLVLPRTMAFSLASFTLGVFFVLAALVMGFVASSFLGAVRESLLEFFNRVLTSMQTEDFVLFPVKMLCIGAMVALTACLTALTARPGEEPAALLPRGFVRGVLAVMLTSLVFSLAA
jgi:phospholipid/cholesterol/gamma-HCH transport system permease protein